MWICGVILLVPLIVFVVAIARHDQSTTGLIELQGKPRRWFLLGLTKFVRDLRPLENEDRLRIANEALRKYGYRMASERIVTLVVAVFASSLFWGCIGFSIWRPISDYLWKTFGGDRFFWQDQSTAWYAAAVVITTFFTWFLVFVIQVHIAVRQRVDDFRCPQCRYSLVGLVKDETILCPECGRTSRVIARGLHGYKDVVPLDRVFRD